MTGVFSNAFLLSSLTILSRLLGLARDILLFTAFGTSFFGEAFILAFTLPNLFRRMLGEGTLSSAFIPVYASSLSSKSIQSAFELLNKVLSRLSVSLFSLSVLVCLASYYLSSLLTDSKWSTASHLNSISFCYVAFICCAAIKIGALNSHGRFAAGGISPLILNLAMIGTLSIFGVWKNVPLDDLAAYLCGAVVLGGLFQMLFPAIELKVKLRWKYKFDLQSSLELEKVNQIFWIGALGAAVTQINILVSRFLAFSLDDSGALSYLFLSSRLIELPLGVFAISLSTVLFPELAKRANDSDQSRFKECVTRGVRLTLGITIPAAFGLGLLATPILSLLFNWGMFTSNNVLLASEILLISVLALPFYASSGFLVKVFHSKKNMKAPLHAAILSMSVNLLMSVVLMRFYGVYGLAWANVLAALVQTVFLFIKTREVNLSNLLKIRPLYILPVLGGSLVMCGVIEIIAIQLPVVLGKWGDLISLLVLIPTGLICYLGVLYLFQFPELRNINQVLSRKSG
jgi:putative peptidoglycan lipid II flippase